MNPLKHTLPEPERPSNVPIEAQWLSGEGAGSWFSIIQKEQELEINRHSPEGQVECGGLFKNTSEADFKIDQAYQVVHLSHCQQVRVLQNDRTLILIRI